METQSTKFLNTIKKIKSSNFIYLSVILILFIVVIILFLYSTNFILKNINKRFSAENNDTTKNLILDIKSYSLVEHKLNLKSSVDVNETNTNITH